MLPGHLVPVQPYNFDLALAAVRLHSVLDSAAGGVYRRALALGDSIALVEVASSGPAASPELAVRLLAHTGPVAEAVLLAQVRRLLGVDSTLAPFFDFARRDPALWQVVAPLYGLRHIRSASLFEALVVTIIEQQIALKLAQRGERWLLAWGGGFIDYGGQRYYTFPEPARLAAASPDDLAPLKITGRRMGVIIDIARQVDSGTLDPNTTRPPTAIYHDLLNIKGVGPWTAAWAVIRATGHYQYMGESDVALQAAVNHYFYGKTGRAPRELVRDTLRAYEPYAGAAAFFTLMRWGLDRY